MSDKAKSPTGIPDGEAYVTIPTHESTAPDTSAPKSSPSLVAAPAPAPLRTRGAGQDSGKPNPGGRIRNLFRQSAAGKQGVSLKAFVAAIMTAVADSLVYGVRASRDAIKAAVAWKTAKAKKPVKTKHPKRVKKVRTKVQDASKKDGKKSKDAKPGTAPTAASTATPAATPKK